MNALDLARTLRDLQRRREAGDMDAIYARHEIEQLCGDELSALLDALCVAAAVESYETEQKYNSWSVVPKLRERAAELKASL